MADVRPFDFVGPDFPAVGAADTLEVFFAAMLQQFGFWQARAGRYWPPMRAPLAGSIRKGSDYLWCALLRAHKCESALLTLRGQAAMTAQRLRALFRADDGSNHVSALKMRLQQARACGCCHADSRPIAAGYCGPSEC